MRTIVVDCKGHLKGRLASVVAKQILKGQHIVLVRCEEANVSGSYIHNKIAFMNYLHKTMRTNPSRGHRHFRAPSMMIYKAIRGMVPHKTTRGAEALKRLHVYDGCPPRYSRVKKMVIPDALRVLVMKPTSKYIRLGDLASQMGWKYGPLIRRLEKERLHYAKIWYHRKVRAMKKHQEGLRALRHLIPKKPKKGAKKVEKKEEEKKAEGAEEAKTEAKKVEKHRSKKGTFRRNKRRLHKLAVIAKVNRLEAAAKKQSKIRKEKKAAFEKMRRQVAAKKLAEQKKREKKEKKIHQEKMIHKAKLRRMQARKAAAKKASAAPKAAKAAAPKAAKKAVKA